MGTEKNHGKREPLRFISRCVEAIKKSLSQKAMQAQLNKGYRPTGKEVDRFFSEERYGNIFIADQNGYIFTDDQVVTALEHLDHLVPRYIAAKALKDGRIPSSEHLQRLLQETTIDELLKWKDTTLIQLALDNRYLPTHDQIRTCFEHEHLFFVIEAAARDPRFAGNIERVPFSPKDPVEAYVLRDNDPTVPPQVAINVGGSVFVGSDATKQIERTHPTPNAPLSAAIDRVQCALKRVSEPLGI